MKRESNPVLRIGDWCFDAGSGQISRNGASVRLDVRAMRLLLTLSEHVGEVVCVEDLITQVWGDIAVSPDSLYQAVTSLRRQLGDDSRRPKYIETVPRLGYRMIAAVAPWAGSLDGPTPARNEAHRGDRKETKTQAVPVRPRTILWGSGVLVVASLIGVLLYARINADRHPPSSAAAASPQQSIAVLPFLDLTEGMHNEEFADGMTEELIDKLSKVPGLSVPSATSSFYFKGRQTPIIEIARTLNVAYILDGSVRKSGGRVRVAARLVRAESSFVVWSETYDRSFDDLIMVQDDIAGEVTKSLRSSITPQPGNSR